MLVVVGDSVLCGVTGLTLSFVFVVSVVVDRL